MFNEETEKVLKHDSLFETEQIFDGKHWSQFNKEEEAFSIFKFISDNAVKKNHLKSIGDTYWCISWNDFVNVIESYGFEKAWSTYFDNDGKREEEIIYYHLDKGLILWAESYTSINKDINSGHVYALADISNKNDNWWEYSEGSTSCDNNLLSMDFDIREGVIHKCEKVSNLSLLNKWSQKQHWLHFVNFKETENIKNKSLDDYFITRNKITQEKINACCDNFKTIINGITYEGR